MPAIEIAAQLASFEGRAAGTDAERRAARWLADQLTQSGRPTQLDTFWCRPNWALAHAWHAALALAGSLVSVSAPRAGIVLLVIALLSTIADSLTGMSLGRRLTPERASQNVVAAAPAPAGPTGATGATGATRADPPKTKTKTKTKTETKTRLILTANYDAGRAGFIYRDELRRMAASVHRLAGPLALGWLAWLDIAVIALLAVAAARAGGAHGAAISAIQLAPTVALVLTLALLLEQGTSGPSAAAGDNASGTAAALWLTRALDASPPQNLTVELVLQGAGDHDQLGLRRYLKERRAVRAADTVVLGINACGAGRPRWWTSDGRLLALRYARPLTDLCRRLATREPHLEARPYAGRGATPAYPARQARRLPATTIGCLDERGLIPRSHRPSDTGSQLDERALDATIQFALMFVDTLDAQLATLRRSPASRTPA